MLIVIYSHKGKIVADLAKKSSELPRNFSIPAAAKGIARDSSEWPFLLPLALHIFPVLMCFSSPDAAPEPRSQIWQTARLADRPFWSSDEIL